MGLVQKTVINFIKSAKKSFFISENMKKYRKCPALVPRVQKVKVRKPSSAGFHR